VIGPISHDFHLSADQQSVWYWIVWFVGIMIGALGFGYLADRVGRRRLFSATLILYSVGAILTATSWGYASFLFFRFLTALGVGGEYSAVSSAMAEFVPARVRGRTNALIMNFWSLGGIVAGIVGIVFINGVLGAHGWRYAFLFGAVSALYGLYVRRVISDDLADLGSHIVGRTLAGVVLEVDNRDAGRTGPLKQLSRLIQGGSDPIERHDPPDISVLAVDHDEGGIGQTRRGRRQAAEGSQGCGLRHDRSSRGSSSLRLNVLLLLFVLGVGAGSVLGYPISPQRSRNGQERDRRRNGAHRSPLLLRQWRPPEAEAAVADPLWRQSSTGLRALYAAAPPGAKTRRRTSRLHPSATPSAFRTWRVSAQLSVLEEADLLETERHLRRRRCHRPVTRY